jgi:hypothetical protein
MTTILRMVDGVALTAQQERQAWGAVHGGGAGRQLGGRSGFKVGTPSTVLTATSTTWTLGACSAMLDPGAAVHQGMYGWSSDANITGTVTAADSTNPRKDIVYIQVNDSDVDTSGAKSAPVLYLAGTPAPTGTNTPAAPALPARSFLVGTITIPQAGGGSPTVVLNPARYVAAGGLLPISSNTERAALTPYDGMAIARTDYDGIEIYDGTEWGGPLTATLVTPPDSGWSIAGGITRVNAQAFKQFRATLKLTRVGAAAATINQTYNALLAGTIPAAYRPAVDVQGHAVMSTTGGTFRANLECFIGASGDIAFRIESGSVTLAANDVFYVDMGWWQ